MTEEVSSSPQKASLGTRHLCPEIVGHLVNISQRLAQRIALRRNIPVVEGEEWNIENVKQIECRIRLGACCSHRIASVHPGPKNGGHTKRIASVHRETMPIGHRKPQMLAQRFTENDAVGVIPAIGELVAAIRPPEPDGRKLRKNRLLQRNLSGSHNLHSIDKLLLDAK